MFAPGRGEVSRGCGKDQWDSILLLNNVAAVGVLLPDDANAAASSIVGEVGDAKKHLHTANNA